MVVVVVVVVVVAAVVVMPGAHLRTSPTFVTRCRVIMRERLQSKIPDGVF
ncbi:hypothetical protein E2C01_083672 [Portunus trituberculatus]|uniref:Uncharacterized protein n=1 Tax=Portunus trituberculatus TaxID=210409 RepID=A0A5B7IXT0_PORTR|nr:hypothetical protein [Portunus trituberculatus]